MFKRTIISPNEVFGDIMVLASPPRPHLRQPVDPDDVNTLIQNKATRSPEISREQVQRQTPQFLLYIYIGYRFPLSISTIWGNHLPVNFMLKFPTCISTIWRNHLPYLTSK